MDSNTIAALIGLVGLVLAGLIAWASKRSGDKLTDEGQFRKDLMDQNKSLREALAATEKEADTWRDRYYAEVSRSHAPAQQTTVVVQQPPQLSGGA